jgi:hypothetical protein
MIIELGLNAFFTYWIISEYQYNIYFHQYVDSMILAHLTTYTALLGVTIGLVGTAIAATLYRNLKHAKIRLERLSETKLKPTMGKMLEKMPLVEDSHQSTALVVQQDIPVQATSNIVPSQTTGPSGTMPVLPIRDEQPQQSKQ